MKKKKRATCHPDRPHQGRGLCRTCHRKQWSRTPKGIAAWRNWMLKTQYGISESDYSDLIRKQGGVCAICFMPKQKQKRRFSVDHDHNTGTVRALLCGRCNTSLGVFEFSSGWLISALCYLYMHESSAIETISDLLPHLEKLNVTDREPTSTDSRISESD